MDQKTLTSKYTESSGLVFNQLSVSSKWLLIVSRLQPAGLSWEIPCQSVKSCEVASPGAIQQRRSQTQTPSVDNGHLDANLNTNRGTAGGPASSSQRTSLLCHPGVAMSRSDPLSRHSNPPSPKPYYQQFVSDDLEGIGAWSSVAHSCETDISQLMIEHTRVLSHHSQRLGTAGGQLNSAVHGLPTQDTLYLQALLDVDAIFKQ